MAARHEQIGQRAGHEQTMGVLVEPAVAHLGKAEHPLDDPDRMLDPGPHFGFGAVFRSLDLIHDAAVVVAAIDEIPGLGSVLPDHRALAAVGLITPTRGSRCHATARAIPCRRRHWPAWRQPRGSAWCGCRPRNAPSSRNTTGCPSWSDASRDRAPSWRSWSTTAH